MSKIETSAHSPRSKGSSRQRVWLLAAIAAAIAVSAIGLASLAEAGSRWFGGHGHGGQGFEAERAHEHAEFATSWALRKVDATDEQEARIQQIVSGVVDELGAMRASHGGQHEAFAALLAADTIDRDELETLRVQQIAMAESASSLLAAAIADIAETLTPEQRSELVEHLRSHRRGHGWRH